MLARPDHLPELLALAAVRTLGPVARDWVRRMRADYPTASPDGLARLATRRFVRFGVAGGVVATASGLLMPLVELAATVWAQAGLALHVAACYGQDPTDPERAVELLVLTRVHADEESARAALAAAESTGVEPGPTPGRLVAGMWRLASPLGPQAGGWLLLRMVGRALPGSRPLAAVAGNSAAAHRLAARVVARYRPVEKGGRAFRAR